MLATVALESPGQAIAAVDGDRTLVLASESIELRAGADLSLVWRVPMACGDGTLAVSGDMACVVTEDGQAWRLSLADGKVLEIAGAWEGAPVWLSPAGDAVGLKRGRRDVIQIDRDGGGWEIAAPWPVDSVVTCGGLLYATGRSAEVSAVASHPLDGGDWHQIAVRSPDGRSDLLRVVGDDVLLIDQGKSGPSLTSTIRLVESGGLGPPLLELSGEEAAVFSSSHAWGACSRSAAQLHVGSVQGRFAAATFDPPVYPILAVGNDGTMAALNHRGGWMMAVFDNQGRRMATARLRRDVGGLPYGQYGVLMQERYAVFFAGRYLASMRLVPWEVVVEAPGDFLYDLTSFDAAIWGGYFHRQALAKVARDGVTWCDLPYHAGVMALGSDQTSALMSPMTATRSQSTIARWSEPGGLLEELGPSSGRIPRLHVAPDGTIAGVSRYGVYDDAGPVHVVWPDGARAVVGENRIDAAPLVGNRLISVGRDGSVYLASRTGSELVLASQLPGLSDARSVVVEGSPTDELVAVAAQNLWLVHADGQVRGPLPGVGDDVIELAFDQSGTYLFGGTQGGYILCWEVDPSMALVWSIGPLQSYVKAILPTPHGLYFGGGDGRIYRLGKGDRS